MFACKCNVIPSLSLKILHLVVLVLKKYKLLLFVTKISYDILTYLLKSTPIKRMNERHMVSIILSHLSSKCYCTCFIFPYSNGAIFIASPLQCKSGIL